MGGPVSRIYDITGLDSAIWLPTTKCVPEVLALCKSNLTMYYRHVLVRSRLCFFFGTGGLGRKRARGWDEGSRIPHFY